MSEFTYVTEDKVDHGQRAKKILREHPEVKKWTTKKNPWSFLLVLLMVGLQTSAAILLRAEPWWVVLLAAFFIGTIVNHCCIALVHEASHDMLFKKRIWNLFSGLLVNVHMLIPSFVSFRKYHLKHHSRMGLYEIDADLPSEWEIKAVKNIWYRKFLWILMFPLWQVIRTLRVKQVKDFDRWFAANLVLTIGYDIMMYYFFGPIAFLYIAASFWFAFGFSFVGARIIQEHFVFKEGQETYSYYGVLSLPSLHVGHHSEHHDFPTIPWNYLPKLRRLVPELYDKLYYHTSWGKLLFRFIFDPKVSLSHRIIRDAGN